MKRLAAIVLALLLLAAPAVAAPLHEIYSIIETFHIDADAVDWEALLRAGPSGLGAVLGDPYTVYYPPEQFRKFLKDFYGTYGGTGMALSQEEGRTVVREVFPGTPAERAGLKPGDILVSVDGVPVFGLSLEEVVLLIRGTPGTRVVLELEREGLPFTRGLLREDISSPTVTAFMLGDTGYLAVYGFNENTPGFFREKLARLKRQNPRGYILDLRDNPGGLLSAVLAAAEELLPPGPVVTLRGRHGYSETYENRRGAGPLPNLVVLVNGGTASSAEILAGAIQDYGAGILLGEPTFGKASVQTVFLLSDGSGLKVTTGRYYTPHGRSVSGTGLMPGLVVSGPEGQLAAALAYIRSTGPTLVFKIGETVARCCGVDISLSGAPYLEGGRGFVPLRPLAEAMGATVLWDGKTRTATLKTERTQIKIPAGQSRGLQDGREFDLAARTVLKGGRLFVPVRAVAAALGGRAWWHGSAWEVIVTWPRF